MIENKKSDAVSLGGKAEAWNQTKDRFNSSTVISEKVDYLINNSMVNS